MQLALAILKSRWSPLALHLCRTIPGRCPKRTGLPFTLFLRLSCEFRKQQVLVALPYYFKPSRIFLYVTNFAISLSSRTLLPCSPANYPQTSYMHMPRLSLLVQLKLTILRSSRILFSYPYSYPDPPCDRISSNNPSLSTPLQDELRSLRCSRTLLI